MRMRNAEYAARPWRIVLIAPDFKLLDAWDTTVQGSQGEFDAFLDTVNTLDPEKGGSRVVRALFRLRHRLGRWFGWNDGGWGVGDIKLAIPGCTETTLGARLPEDLKNTVPVPQNSASKWRTLYHTEDEFAAELSNKTVHVVKHLVWVAQGAGRYRGQMGVYVKPRGWFGSFYLTLIGPFRHAIVYPAGMRRIRRAWEARSAIDALSV